MTKEMLGDHTQELITAGTDGLVEKLSPRRTLSFAERHYLWLMEDRKLDVKQETCANFEFDSVRTRR